MAMVGKDLDNSTLFDPLVVADDHRLKLVAQRHQSNNLVVDRIEMRAGDLMDLAA